MNKINKKIGILIGVGTAITMGTIMSAFIKKKTKNLSKFEEDEFGLDFGDIEDESFVKNEFDTENAKNNVRKEDRDSLEDKFLDYESKTEEEKQEEFRDLLVKGMNSFLKELISIRVCLKT